VLEPDHPDTVSSLSNLADLYKAQHKYELAEPLYQRALSIREQVLAPAHPDTASSLDKLADLYSAQHKYELAEPLYQRALAIYDQVLGPDHPAATSSLNNLANLYRSQGKYSAAEHLYHRILSITKHPSLAASRVELYILQDNSERDEIIRTHIRTFYEPMPDSNHILTAITLYNLGILYQIQQKHDDAEHFYRRALDICSQVLGDQNPVTPDILTSLAALLRKTRRLDEAAELEKRIAEIQNSNIDENSGR
jgi:tetratricopeptide (TPR) repeat protein